MYFEVVKKASTRFLLELARCVADYPAQNDTAPILDIGTRSGGSALVILKIIDAFYTNGKTKPYVLILDPYGMRPYEAEPLIYAEHDTDLFEGEVKKRLDKWDITTNHVPRHF